VLHDQRRYQQTEGKAQRLQPPHTQVASDVDCPEGEREMDRERTIEQWSADRAAPDHLGVLRTPLHRLEGDVAQAVIEKMQEQIGKQYQTAGQPKPSDDRRPAPHQLRPAAFP
jgi:hypothetical protein